MTSPFDATAPCEQCDGSVPHRHQAPGASRVRAESRALGRWAGLRVAALVVVVAVTAAVATPGVDVAATRLGLLLPAGAAAWAVVTAVGLLVAGSLHRPEQPGTASRALALGTIAAAAALPLLALAVALLLRPDAAATLPTRASPGAAWAGWWPAAAWIGVGWLVAALAADVVGALRLRRLLGSSARRGEEARHAVAARPLHHARHIAGSLGGAAAFSLWAAGLGALPAAVAVAVPLHAAVAARLAHARLVSPETRRKATLRE